MFRVRTTRNYYFEKDLNDLVNLIADKNRIIANEKEIQRLFSKLKTYKLDKNDPLLKFLEDLEKTDVPIKSKK